MTTKPAPLKKVGEIRPSQFLFTYGIGSIVELPRLSVMVMGLDDWETGQLREVRERRLLSAVKSELGQQVQRLVVPPVADESASLATSPFSEAAAVGVPVAPFPRWMHCPSCDLLAPLRTGLFTLKMALHWTGKTQYVHANCARGTGPSVVPARFLVACEHGHLDDFPWAEYVHRAPTTCKFSLRLSEKGLSGSAGDVWVNCTVCNAKRPMADAFGPDAEKVMPICRGRRPHLRDHEDCKERMQTILLGASNSWFPITLSALSLPDAPGDVLAELVENQWGVLGKAKSLETLRAFRSIGQLDAFAGYSDEDVWKHVKKRISAGEEDREDTEGDDLRGPEWRVLSKGDSSMNGMDFQLTPVDPPKGYERVIERVVLVERLREVRALIGFSRVEAPGDFGDVPDVPKEVRAPLARKDPVWVPSVEVRGEGVFLQFKESVVASWSADVADRAADFEEAHRRWRKARQLDPNTGFPGARYILLHGVAHALIRQFAVECGYTAASIRERIYALDPDADGGPMAGILLYTAAPDSEGTLGGLVGLGEPKNLARHLGQALEQMKLCGSDPLCAEHHPYKQGISLHGAACHACMFAPETSCERGNKYLDRTLLVPTVSNERLAFFAKEVDRK